MKKRIASRILIFSFFSLSLITGILYSLPAAATDEAKGEVVHTVCCNGNQWTGNCNDCTTGTGGCVDHTCLATETEKTSCSN